jgi:hypothetical protein
VNERREYGKRDSNKMGRLFSKYEVNRMVINEKKDSTVLNEGRKNGPRVGSRLEQMMFV